MKIDKTKVCLFLSLLLNALGGSGIIPPVFGAPSACPPAAVVTPAK